MNSKHFSFFLNLKLINIPILACFFKQKEHEFARIAIATTIESINPDKLIIDNFFQGVFFESFIENKHKWIVFVAASSLSVIDRNKILYCDPWTLEIKDITLNNEVLFTLKNVLSLKQKINNKIPQKINIIKKEHSVQEHIINKEKKFIIYKDNNIKAYINFIKRLKNIGDLHIIDNGAYKEILLKYKHKIVIKYDLHKEINIKDNQIAFGELNIFSDYTTEQIEQKLKRLNFNIFNKIIIPINIKIKVGNNISYKGIVGWVSSVEHRINHKGKFSILNVFSSNINQNKSLKLEKEREDTINKSIINITQNFEENNLNFTSLEKIIVNQPIEKINIVRKKYFIY